ncbi:protein TWIN LOV 1 [Cynara cardunculus var. scolymus]|uniref:PAC motif-containing protein n=1 Tax=Cynara cardunculus var. scolymus TaxID=59895 RepID=A0A103YAL6_CYNCS|nr:protein TWIN LOV 1 [Cynara cardunculus var. scolymus]KVI05579.1 PAC motif-containing protein [Cynara cardunculus var. scolymus]
MEQQPMGIAIEQSITSRYSSWVREALDELPHSFTITDPSISGHPIVFASREFLKMSGYSREEVIGKNGRMFQGIRTNRRSVMEIREAIREERSLQVSLLNYRKNGTPFWILFHMFPVFSKEDGRVIHFVGIQVPIVPKPRRSGSEFSRIEANFCENGAGFRDSVLGFCRREVCSDTVAELGRSSNLDSVLTDDTEVTNGTCKASDLEKRRANTAMSNILSMLTHYSELTGRLVSDRRCCSSNMSHVGASLNTSLGRIRQSFVLTDPHKIDIPIVYASDAFLDLTGYARHEVLGRNCRFLSGQETDGSTQLQITNSIQTGKACTVCILNYRKNGRPFWNSLHVSPVRNASGKIAYFVEVQTDVNCGNHGNQNLSPEIRQLSVVGAVKVAVRSSAMFASTSES